MNMTPLDPYIVKASVDAPLKQKAEEVAKIVQRVRSAMLTTRQPDGSLNSRAMEPVSRKGLVFQFIANNHSGKFDDLQKDGSCNISFYDPVTTDWVSVSGQAKIIEDLEEIKKIWDPILSAWFGNLGDGKHTGKYDDPRVSGIRVKPTAIRYWVAKSQEATKADIDKALTTGEVAAPGVLRVISGDELTQLSELSSNSV